MIGLFLALLELIRAKLVWAEQPESPSAALGAGSADIYLRSLTDEPAEEIVPKAIFAAAEPPIPIAELPPKSRPESEPDRVRIAQFEPEASTRINTD